MLNSCGDAEEWHMLRTLDAQNASRAADPAYRQIRIGIGLHTGELTSGTIGSRSRMEYPVWPTSPRATLPASPRLTSNRQSLDTARSALTGRHQPAAREHSHLFWSESCACAPSFSLVSAGYRRFMKEGRNDRFEISPDPSVSRIPS